MLAYTLLGALRAYRDYFQIELFVAVGLSGRSTLFAASEFTVSFVVLLATAAFGLGALLAAHQLTMSAAALMPTTFGATWCSRG